MDEVSWTKIAESSANVKKTSIALRYINSFQMFSNEGDGAKMVVFDLISSEVFGVIFPFISSHRLAMTAFRVGSGQVG